MDIEKEENKWHNMLKYTDMQKHHCISCSISFYYIYIYFFLLYIFPPASSDYIIIKLCINL